MRSTFWRSRNQLPNHYPSYPNLASQCRSMGPPNHTQRVLRTPGAFRTTGVANVCFAQAGAQTGPSARHQTWSCDGGRRSPLPESCPAPLNDRVERKAAIHGMNDAIRQRLRAWRDQTTPALSLARPTGGLPLVFTTRATRPCRRPGKHLSLDALRCQPPPQNRQYGIMASFRDTTPERSLPPSSPQASDSAAPSLLEQGNLFTQDCRGRPAACRSIPIRQVDRSTCLPQPLLLGRPHIRPPALPSPRKTRLNEAQLLESGHDGPDLRD